MIQVYYNIYECLHCENGYLGIVKHVQVNGDLYFLCKNCREDSKIGKRIEKDEGSDYHIPLQYRKHMVQAGSKLMDEWLKKLGRK